MHLLSVAILSVCVFCVHGKVITNPVEWRVCCPNCPWEWPYESKQKPICQYYNNVPYYATLYSTSNRIPVFSQFNLNRNNSRSVRIEFAVEPQLINLNLRASQNMMQEEDLNTNERNSLGHNQATLEDYRKGSVYDRGHLNPSAGHDQPAAVSATYTLTNVVPQVGSFNKGCWQYSEEATRNYVRDYCFPNNVVVGAVPGFATKMNDRVNVPSYMWSTIQCQGNVVAFIAPNVNNNVIEQNRWMTLFYFRETTLPLFMNDIRGLYRAANQKDLSKLVKKLKSKRLYFEVNPPAAFTNSNALGRCLSPYRMRFLKVYSSETSMNTGQPIYILLALLFIRYCGF